MPLPWWADRIDVTHTTAAIVLFSMFAVFSLWLFRKTRTGDEPSADKQRQDAIYLLCGIGILTSMAWAVIARMTGRSIFWPESFALGFFAWSWLVKGRALASIGSTLATTKNKFTK